MSVSLTCQILGLLVNTFSADEKYPLRNRDNLTIPIQMQLSQKHKTFSEYFAAFLKFRLNFKYFKTKYDPHRFCICKITDSKTCSNKFLKSLIWENPLKTNMVNVPKNCWNLHHSNFMTFIDHCQVNWAGKCLSHWHVKSWDCLLTHLLPMKSILFLIETI